MLDYIRSELISFLLALPCILIAIPAHEVAHGYMAYKLGDPTARNFGRLTLNPLKHFDPLGVICMLFAGFGWARPVPVNTRHFKKPRRDMALVALAGPVANMILAFLGLLIYAVLIKVFAANLLSSSGGYSVTLFSMLLSFIQLFFTLNASLAVFNLLPIPPLDGSRLLMIFLPPKAYMWVVRNERYITLAVFILLITDILDVPLAFLRNLVLTGMSYLIGLIPFL